MNENHVKVFLLQEPEQEASQPQTLFLCDVTNKSRSCRLKWIMILPPALPSALSPPPVSARCSSPNTASHFLSCLPLCLCVPVIWYSPNNGWLAAGGAALMKANMMEGLKRSIVSKSCSEDEHHQPLMRKPKETRMMFLQLQNLLSLQTLYASYGIISLVFYCWSTHTQHRLLLKRGVAAKYLIIFPQGEIWGTGVKRLEKSELIDQSADDVLFAWEELGP